VNSPLLGLGEGESRPDEVICQPRKGMRPVIAVLGLYLVEHSARTRAEFEGLPPSDTGSRLYTNSTSVGFGAVARVRLIVSSTEMSGSRLPVLVCSLLLPRLLMAVYSKAFVKIYHLKPSQTTIKSNRRATLLAAPRIRSECFS
jgi:hypothetical protein